MSAANLAANPVALTALAILTVALTVLAWTAAHRRVPAKTATVPRSGILHRHHGRHVRGRHITSGHVLSAWPDRPPLLGLERRGTPTSDDGVTV